MKKSLCKHAWCAHTSTSVVLVPADPKGCFRNARGRGRDRKGIRKVGVILPKAGLNRPGLKVTEQAMGGVCKSGGCGNIVL